jgi:hypothetical protein
VSIRLLFVNNPRLGDQEAPGEKGGFHHLDSGVTYTYASKKNTKNYLAV